MIYKVILNFIGLHLKTEINEALVTHSKHHRSPYISTTFMRFPWYFAHPYSSWERGANENANGLLRQYVKKGTDLTTVTDSDIEFALSRINYRPRKCLGFKQPAIVFEKMALAA